MPPPPKKKKTKKKNKTKKNKTKQKKKQNKTKQKKQNKKKKNKTKKKQEKKEEKKTRKAGMHKEYSIEKWNILSPLCLLIQITNQHSCDNLRKLRCSTAINLQINSNRLVLRSSINNSRVI